MKKLIFCLLILAYQSTVAQDKFSPLDVYQLEFAINPQFSPDGKAIIYERQFLDIMTDKRLSNLWITDKEGSKHRPLTSGNHRHHSSRWSPDGKSIIYLSNESGKTQIHRLWLDDGRSGKISNLQGSPANLRWSPDGQWLAFTMSVPKSKSSPSVMPAKPHGATWANPPQYYDQLIYRADGAGYINESYNHIFVFPASGGTPRQISSGDFNHSNPLWSPDGKTLYCSANRNADWEYQARDTDLFAFSVADGSIQQLTDRDGPDEGPSLSPDGKTIAYIGYDDQKLGYHHNYLYTINADGSNRKNLTDQLDLSVNNLRWAKDGQGIYFRYDEKGNTKVGYISKNGEMKSRARDLGGNSIGRPYNGGSYDVHNGDIVFSQSKPVQPTELALLRRGSEQAQLLTQINADLSTVKKWGQVKEIWYKSSHDQRMIQGWVMTPPDFDSSKKYPLILEIHGGPFSNYGDRFSAELQLFASKGYVVLYTNPRGSTSYGAEFANLIHHNYPSNDYDDLMSGVDALLAEGYIDPQRLFVTGGSGGGVLTSWIVGKTDRFAAAVVAKPVINWYSWALTADIGTIANYWFPGMPWEHQDHFMKRSPISLVGNVKTPTMLLTGEEDYRTPMSESEQYYQALKLRKIPTALVRIQGASHGIAARPSNLLAKVGYITYWFEQHD